MQIRTPGLPDVGDTCSLNVLLQIFSRMNGIKIGKLPYLDSILGFLTKSSSLNERELTRTLKLLNTTFRHESGIVKGRKADPDDFLEYIRSVFNVGEDFPKFGAVLDGYLYPYVIVDLREFENGFSNYIDTFRGVNYPIIKVDRHRDDNKSDTTPTPIQLNIHSDYDVLAAIIQENDYSHTHYTVYFPALNSLYNDNSVIDTYLYEAQVLYYVLCKKTPSGNCTTLIPKGLPLPYTELTSVLQIISRINANIEGVVPEVDIVLRYLRGDDDHHYMIDEVIESLALKISRERNTDRASFKDVLSYFMLMYKSFQFPTLGTFLRTDNNNTYHALYGNIHAYDLEDIKNRKDMKIEDDTYGSVQLVFDGIDHPILHFISGEGEYGPTSININGYSVLAILTKEYGVYFPLEKVYIHDYFVYQGERDELPVLFYIFCKK